MLSNSFIYTDCIYEKYSQFSRLSDEHTLMMLADIIIKFTPFNMNLS